VPHREGAERIERHQAARHVEMQHAAILNFVLGQDPVPDAFAKTDGSRPVTDVVG